MILLIDNYDSFSYNLYQMTGTIEPDIRVIRNDAFTVEQILYMRPSGIILSPGPGRPEDAGVCIGLVKRIGQVCDTEAGQSERAAGDGQPEGEARAGQSEAAGEHSAVNTQAPAIPLLGVCLGHQSICAAFGARIGYAKELMHGKTSQCRIDTASRIFSGLDAVEQVGRYHSLAAEEATMPDCLKITARTEDDEIMAVEHTRYPIFGIQFHPESILTPHGSRILENFVNLSKRRNGR